MPVPTIQNILYVTVIIGKPAKMKKESIEGYIYDHWPGAVSSTEIEAPTTEARDEEAAAENGGRHTVEVAIEAIELVIRVDGEKHTMTPVREGCSQKNKNYKMLSNLENYHFFKHGGEAGL